MSIAVDLGLFLRNSKTKLGLSLTHRGLLFTLAIRIGNNAYTWIKQDTLANEAGIDIKNLQDHLKKIQASGILLIERQSSDKRKNQYKFNPSIVNYHLLSESEKQKVHLLLKDEYHPQTGPKLSTGGKNGGRKVPPNFGDRGENHPLNTGVNHPAIQKEKNLGELERQGLQAEEQSPKGTVQSYITAKLQPPGPSYKSCCPQTDEQILSPEAIKLAAQKKINILVSLSRFKEYASKQGWMCFDWKAAFLKWVEKERQPSEQHNANSKTNDLKSTVKFWEPGNPDYDRVHAC